MYYSDSIHPNNPDKALLLDGQVVNALDEGAFSSSRPREKPFISLVSLTSNTPQNNVAALEEKVFCFLVGFVARFLFPLFLSFFLSLSLSFFWLKDVVRPG
jgi:hypothetical protein